MNISQAFRTAQHAQKTKQLTTLQTRGTLLIPITNKEREDVLFAVRSLHDNTFESGDVLDVDFISQYVYVRYNGYTRLYSFSYANGLLVYRGIRIGVQSYLSKVRIG